MPVPAREVIGGRTWMCHMFLHLIQNAENVNDKKCSCLIILFHWLSILICNNDIHRCEDHLCLKLTIDSHDSLKVVVVVVESSGIMWY
jgi:hypothetical protein